MSYYIHHVPGRLRVKSRSLRCNAQRVKALADELLTLDGVEEVSVSQKTGSVIVRYDTQCCDQRRLLLEFERAGCIKRAVVAADSHSVGQVAQRALFGTLVHMTVERSVRSLVGALV